MFWSEFLTKGKPLVSVIVPTKNSEATIGKCLESVKNQTYPNIEIIVVDCFSKDRTRKIAADHKARIFDNRAKRSEARNIGAEKARGDLVVFVDSDMELDSSVVVKCVKKIREKHDGVIIPEISVGQGFLAKCKALEKSCYIDDDSIEAARFFVKNAFESVGGYDCELEAGEDWDISQRIKNAGFKVGRVRASLKHHEGQLRLWETMKKKYRYGKTIQKYKRKHPREAKQQLRLIRSAFITNRKNLIENPIMAIGLGILRSLELGAGGIGYLRGKFLGTLI